MSAISRSAAYNQIKGFGSYGFPESHAQSFAKLVYVSAWLKCHYPAVFTCGLLNSQPMGFYAPAQLVRDAREHGVEVREVDINASDYDNLLERRRGRRAGDPFGLSPGRRLSQGMGGKAGRGAERGLHPGRTIEPAGRNCRPGRCICWPMPMPLVRSVSRGAKRCGKHGGPHRGCCRCSLMPTQQSWARSPEAALPAMPLPEEVVTDYQVTRLSLKGHPMQFLRSIFEREAVLSCAAAAAAPNGAIKRVAGVVLIRQRPGKGNALFITLEDETGITNVLLWARDFERYRREVMAARLMEVEGEIQRSKEGVMHLIARRVFDRSALLAELTRDEFHPPLAPADVVKNPVYARHGHPRDVRVLPKSRDFH